MANTGLELRKKQLSTIQQFIDKAMPQLQAALPKIGLTPESLARTAFTTIVDSPHLHGAEPRSLVKCIIEGAQLGLSFDKNLGHAYLVPFKGKVQLMPGYRGLIALMDRSGLVRDVVAEAVYEGDLFEYEVTMDRDILRWKPLAKPKDRTDEKLTHVFAIIRLANGGVRHKVLDIEDLLEARNRSAAYQNQGEKSPWGTDFAAMCIKTGIRRVSKTSPMSPSLQKAISLDDDVEAGRPQILADDLLPDEVIDVLAEKASGGEPSTIDKLREKAGVAKADSPAAPAAVPPPVSEAEVVPEPEAPKAAPAAAEEAAGAAEAPRRGRGRPKKTEAPAPSSKADSPAPAAAPAPEQKPAAKSTGRPSVDILRQRLGSDVVKLVDLTTKVLGYERESFNDLFEREAVMLLQALNE